MAADPLTTAATAPGSSGPRLTGAQIVDVWNRQGGSKALGPIMAAIALAESGGRPGAVNNTSSPNLPGYHSPGAGASPEYSVGLWQINYGNGENPNPDRVKSFGSVDQITDPATNARAAIVLAGPKGLGVASNWQTTVRSGSFRNYLKQVPGGAATGGKINLTADFFGQGVTPGQQPGAKPYTPGKGDTPGAAVTGLLGLPNLGSADLWIRIGQVIGGAILAMWGFFLLTKQIGLAVPTPPVPIPARAVAAAV